MAISDKITSIENHLTDDWTNIEALGVDIDCDKNIENIADKLDELWENQSHIEETGTTLSLNTNKGKAKVDLLGNTHQETTSISGGDEYDSPSPDHPQPIQVVSGDNEVSVCGKNLFNYNMIETAGITTKTERGLRLTRTSTARNGAYYTLNLPAGTYRFVSTFTSSSAEADIRLEVRYDDDNVSYYNASANIINFGSSTKSINKIRFYFQPTTPVDEWAQFDDTMIVLSTETDNTFEPYTGTTYPINLGNLELCKIGTYQDKFFKAINGNTIYDNLDSTIKDTLDYGDWYLEKNITKTTNAENLIVGTDTGTDGKRYFRIRKSSLGVIDNNMYTDVMLCNKFNENYAPPRYIGQFQTRGNSTNVLFIVDTQYDTIAKIQEAYPNITCYGAGATPTYTKIEGTLANQLEDVWRANTYDNQTNVSQVNNDLPFELYFKALQNTEDYIAQLEAQVEVSS